MIIRSAQNRGLRAFVRFTTPRGILHPSSYERYVCSQIRGLCQEPNKPSKHEPETKASKAVEESMVSRDEQKAEEKPILPEGRVEQIAEEPFLPVGQVELKTDEKFSSIKQEEQNMEQNFSLENREGQRTEQSFSPDSHIEQKAERTCSSVIAEDLNNENSVSSFSEENQKSEDPVSSESSTPSEPTTEPVMSAPPEASTPMAATDSSSTSLDIQKEQHAEDTCSSANETTVSSHKKEEQIKDPVSPPTSAPSEPASEPVVTPPPAAPTVMAATDSTGAIYADGVLRDFDAEARAEKEFKNRWRKSDNALLIINWRAHGRQKERTLKFPKFMNRFFPELNAPLYVPPPPQPLPEPPVEEPVKPSEPEDPEEAWQKKKKRWRGWGYVFVGASLFMYLYDWYRSRSNARLEAEEIGAPTNREKRILSDLALLLKENVVEFHDWLKENEGDEITVDVFGERLAAASNLFKESNKGMPQLEEFLDKHKPGKQDNGEDYPYEYSQNVEPYDSACLYRDIPSLGGDSKVPLPVLITGISQIIKSNEMPAKLDCGFLAFSIAEEAEDKSLSFQGLLKLIEAMMTTGHFLSETLVNHVQFFPHRYEVASARDIAEEHFRCHELDPDSDDRITLEQFKESNTELPRRRWYRIFDHGYALWYCTKLQIQEAEEKKKEWEKKQKEEAEKREAEENREDDD